MYSSKAWQLIPTCHRHACFIAWGEKENHQQLWVRDANPSRAVAAAKWETQTQRSAFSRSSAVGQGLETQCTLRNPHLPPSISLCCPFAISPFPGAHLGHKWSRSHERSCIYWLATRNGNSSSLRIKSWITSYTCSREASGRVPYEKGRGWGRGRLWLARLCVKGPVVLPLLSLPFLSQSWAGARST